MSFDARFALDTILPLAKTAYDASKLPAGWKILGSIQPADFGYFCQKDEELCATIRGTERFSEWLADFDARPVPAEHGGAGHVARGFQNYYDLHRTSLWERLEQGLREGTFKKKLYITCHSLGGAIGQLFAREVAQQYKSQSPELPLVDCEPTLITFESPRPFWQDAVAQANQLLTEYWRIENPQDIVVHAPPTAFGFQAAGSLVTIEPPFSPDEHVRHGLDSCALGLQKLVG